MEDNKYFYEAEAKQAANRESSLHLQLKAKEETIKRQEMLLEELYKLVYHKRAWLTLSDENIIGLQKVVGKLPQDIEQVTETSTATQDEEPWGV
jgi:hypothetical protein